MKVHVYDPYISESVGRELGVEIMDLEEMLSTCDYLTLHSVLNDETRHLINGERLGLMKEGSVLINVARGGLIDEKAVADSLENGNLRLAAIDVFSSEPPKEDNPLLNNPNVIHTPHLGASTSEAQRDVAIDVANQVLDALRGDKITNCVNLDFSSSIGFDRVAPFIELAEKIGLLQSAMADGPITSVEIEVVSEESDDLVKPVAAGLLKGLMSESHVGRLNYVNAPMLGQENGMEIARSQGIGDGRSNSATCKVKWEGGERIVSGKVYDGSVQRIVRISGYRFEAAPEGTVLLMLNDDVPGVVGAVGSKLGELGINIAEWRLGRDLERNEALSYINLDNAPSESDLEEISELEKVRKAVVIDMGESST